MADHSFDVVSKLDFQEVTNAISQALKEITTRYDLKDSNTLIELREKDLQLYIESADDYKVNACTEILRQKMIKRNISPKVLTPEKVESSLGGRAKQLIKLQQGITKENAKTVTNDIKSTQLKVKTQIQEDQIRVTAPKIDDLQAVMQVLRDKNYVFNIQFLNFR